MNFKKFGVKLEALFLICYFENVMPRRTYHSRYYSFETDIRLNKNGLNRINLNKYGYNRSDIIITETLPSKATKSWHVCLTPGCIKTADRILNQIDPNVDPCEDFYNFACGNFIKNSVIPDDKPSLTQFSINYQVLEQHIKHLVEQPIRNDEIKPYIIAKKLYQICMDTKKIEEIGLKEIKYILKILGGYPVLEGRRWRKRSFHWIKSVFKFRRLGFNINYFIDLGIGPDTKNSTQKILTLDTASLGLKRELLIKGTKEKVVKAYYNFMVDIAVMFGATRKQAAEELYEVLQLQIELAKLSLPAEERRNGNNVYHPMTIEELEQRYPSIPWLAYINTILAPDEEVSYEDVVIVTVPQYISALENLLARTPKRVQANYMMGRVLRSILSYLTEEVSKREFEFYQAFSGTKEKQVRWKTCVGFVTSNIPFALGGMYVKKYFNHESKRIAEAMVQDIKSEFIQTLKEIDWMDEETRTKALNKAYNMMSFVGYPDELVDDKKIEEYYEDLEIDENSFLMTVLKMTIFGTRKAIKQFREPIDKKDWRSHAQPTVVNAYYSMIENGITLPAGILQGIFFNADRPKYMNYGSIGFIIAHEVTHGFDDEGKQYDKDGNLVEWWNPVTKQAFNKKTQCIIEQYGNYSFPEFGMKINGIITQGENIADNGGIKQSYRAYQKWVSHNGFEPQLPGLDYSPNQMFWISAASNWCAKEREEYFKLTLKTASHSPYFYRVVGVVSNSWDFSNDWKCPLGSKMNPTKKCIVW